MFVVYSWPYETSGWWGSEGLRSDVRGSRNVEPGMSNVGSRCSLMARHRAARSAGQNEAESAHD